MDKARQGNPLRIGVLGIEGKALTTLKLFLQGPCKNKAVLVAKESAEVLLIDLDGVRHDAVISEEQTCNPDRPIIVTSFNNPDKQGILYLAKPIKTSGMLAVIDQARLALSSRRPDSIASTVDVPINDGTPQTRRPIESKVEAKKNKPRIRSVRSPRPTHQTAMLLDEKAYSTFVGVVADIDPTDPNQVARAHYDKQKYLQASVETAVRMARTRKRILQLNCGWHPITIFPHSNEIWLDAEDKQVRAFCVVPIGSIMDVDVFGANSNPKSVISPVSPERIHVDRDPRKFQSIDAFIWKIALWTSNGRVPEGIQLDEPVYLKQWPNLSRLVLIPHALRIAALLVDRPISLLDAAKSLQIRQQYVFSFFSAAMALGLAGQIRGQKDPQRTDPRPNDQPSTGLLQKLLHRLKVG